MSFLYGRPVEYAIRALIYLAQLPKGRRATAEEIAQAEDLSAHHLSKILNTLVRKKAVETQRGPGGGYQLVRDPALITLWELMGHFSSQEAIEQCAIGWEACTDERPCPLHDRWVELRSEVHLYLQTVTIADLVEVAQRKDPSRAAQVRFVGKLADSPSSLLSEGEGPGVPHRLPRVRQM